MSVARGTRSYGEKLRVPLFPFPGKVATVNNSSKIESTLNKKHKSAAYHSVRWTVAAKVMVVGWIDTTSDLADAFTKRLSAVRRDQLFGDWTY